MPPTLDSRHILASGVTRIEDGLTYLLDREPFRFVDRPDNRRIIAGVYDTWQSLANEWLKPIRNPAQRWWVLADFQPDPITDPTVPPVPGTLVYIPTPEFVLAEIDSRDRKAEAEI